MIVVNRMVSNRIVAKGRLRASGRRRRAAILPAVKLSDPLRRAILAYLKGRAVTLPDETSSVVTLAGLKYAVLRVKGEPLAIYRVRPNGMLKRLKRPPAGLS